ncbi:MAG: MmgE/PrpD family protein, partial [Deltaproteobacteria bacterium]|nr:MmgE/PrpD family protein [Deltaproteobacteria bacterium]
MNVTRQLAQYITEIRYNDFNNEVIEKAKGLILDQLGCQLAFANMPWSKGIYQYVCSKKYVGGESTVTYYGLKTSAEDAAFANATFGHGFEMDDAESLTASHPGVVVIPPALAIGEQQTISGKDFITAIIAGYDIMLRIGLASRIMMSRGFDTTPTNGTFGATAAVGKILKFNPDIMLNALAIAADLSCGTSEFSNAGGSVKRLHAGFPAQAGIKAALLAQYGISGPLTAIEGKRGFCQAFAGVNEVDEITTGLGKDYKIMLTGNKPYCCCAAQHTVIDATDKISKEHAIEPDNVAEIIVEQRPREVGAVGAIVETPDIVSAQFSGRFGVALRLVKGS